MIKSKSNGQEIELLGPSEAADYLGVSAYMLNKYRNDGWIPPDGFFRVGTGYIYRLDALSTCKEILDADRERINTNVEVLHG
jgi:hypothetical protein